jgi:hypothetical protein
LHTKAVGELHPQQYRRVEWAQKSVEERFAYSHTHEVTDRERERERERLRKEKTVGQEKKRGA